MRPSAVVLISPRLDFYFSILVAGKPMAVQTLVSEATIERLYEGVVDRFARAREGQSDLVGVGPKVRDPSGKFAAVIAEDFLRRSSFDQNLV